jgi:hypothetical protein
MATRSSTCAVSFISWVDATRSQARLGRATAEWSSRYGLWKLQRPREPYAMLGLARPTGVQRLLERIEYQVRSEQLLNQE